MITCSGHATAPWRPPSPGHWSDQVNHPSKAPSSLPFSRPEAAPLLTLIAHCQSGGGGWTSAVARVWPEGHAASACGLCPAGSCGLTDGACLVVVPGVVTDDLAPGLALVGPAPDGPGGRALKLAGVGRDEGR